MVLHYSVDGLRREPLEQQQSFELVVAVPFLFLAAVVVRPLFERSRSGKPLLVVFVDEEGTWALAQVIVLFSWIEW